MPKSAVKYDTWAILHFPEHNLQKLLRFARVGDKWTTNSGIVRVDKEGKSCYIVHGYSGSAYKVDKKDYAHPDADMVQYFAGILAVVGGMVLDKETALKYLENKNNEKSTKPHSGGVQK